MKKMGFRNTRGLLEKTLLRALLILVLIIVVYPLVWNVLSSFKTNQEYMLDPMALPKGIHWENYAKAIEATNMFVTIKNSLYVVAVSLVVLLVCAVPCSYVLVRYDFPLCKSIHGLIMACLFINASYIIIPLFMEIRQFKLLNNLTVIGVLCATFSLPYSVFLLTGYMREIPRDYEEAAILDGCSPYGVLRHVAIPLSKSIIFTVSIINVLSTWGEYAISLVLISDPAKQTYPLAMANLYETARFATDWGALFAAMAVSLVPTLVLFTIGEKYTIKGISIGGLKG